MKRRQLRPCPKLTAILALVHEEPNAPGVASRVPQRRGAKTAFGRTALSRLVDQRGMLVPPTTAAKLTPPPTPYLRVPAVMVLMNITYALAAYPAGALSDRMDRYTILVVGLVLLVLADFFLALSNSISGVALGVVLWGLHMGLTQGLLATLVADAAPAELRGTAYGMFNLITGLALLAASVIAGALWDAIGPRGTCLAGAVFTAVAIGGLITLRRNGYSGGAG
jgi:MFS family permease